MNIEFKEFKRKVFLLNLADLKLEELYKNKKINKKKKKEIKKFLGGLWESLEDFLQDKNPSMKEAFKLGFTKAD